MSYLSARFITSWKGRDVYVIVSTALLAAVFSVISSHVQAAPFCPLESDGRRTIIRFDGSVISDAGGMKETSAFITSIPAGTYDITLVSYDDHNGEATQSAEQWLLFMANNAGSPVGWSKEISDLPDGQQFLAQTVNLGYAVTEPIAMVTARHITVYDAGQHSIIPVCAAFDLKDGSPLVTTGSASSIESDRALLEGNINPNGTSDAVWWFEWGSTPFPLGSKTQERRIANAEHISERITGLQKNTQYYFRAAARNAANTSYGPTLSFITGGGSVQTNSLPSPSPLPCSACPKGLSDPIPPATFTQLPTFVAPTAAVLNGRVTSDTHGGTSVWFEWGKDANLGFATAKKSAGHVSSADFSDSLIGLSPNTFYYFRAVAENTKARSHGAILLFRTLPVPVVHEQTATPPVKRPFPSPAPVMHNPISRTPITSFNQGLGLIAFTIKPSDEIIKVGAVVPFEITFENISKDLLGPAALTIMLPPELAYQDVAGSPADIEKNISINGNLDLVSIRIGEIATGKKESITIRALLKSDTIDKKIFTTSAVITYEDQTSGKGGKETVFAINTARANLSFAALLFAGGLLTWFFLGLIGLLLLLLIFFLLKRRKEEEEKGISV